MTNVTLENHLNANGLTRMQAAQLANVDKSVIAKICAKNYHNWQEKEQEIIALLKEKGYTKQPSDQLYINTDVLVKNRNVNSLFALANDLLDAESSMTSSLGMVIGTAEKGKTHAAKAFCERNENAIYTLFVDGFSRVQLLRNICYELAGTRPYSFGACVSVIMELCKVQRKLLIIDEADKCPLAILEMLRGLNESCGVPILLVGEEQLKGKIDSVPRLRSRIRKPICLFESITASDVSVFYSTSAGLSLDQTLIENLYKRSRGGFRTLVNDSLALAKMARNSGLATITPAMLEKLN